MPKTLLTLAALILAGSVGVANSARAGCCNLVKIDPELPVVGLRVCELGPSGECALVLFEGSVGLGDVENVCTVEDTILYQENEGGGYGSFAEAFCLGADVEI